MLNDIKQYHHNGINATPTKDQPNANQTNQKAQNKQAPKQAHF